LSYTNSDSDQIRNIFRIIPEYEQQTLGENEFTLNFSTFYMKNVKTIHMGISFITRILHHLVLSVFELYLYSDIFSIFKYVFWYIRYFYHYHIHIHILNGYRIRISTFKNQIRNRIRCELSIFVCTPTYQLLTALAWWELGRPKDTWGAYSLRKFLLRISINPQTILSQGGNDAPEILKRHLWDFWIGREAGIGTANTWWRKQLVLKH